jgi:Leucine-rich repeat (LRR) protein
MKKRILALFCAFSMLILGLPTTTKVSSSEVRIALGGGITDEQLSQMIADGTIPYNVTELNLERNLITDISPLAELTHLRALVLRDNQISDLTPLSNLTNLGKNHGWLILSNNQITSLEGLENLTNLGTLNLQGNQITDVSPLANLTDLWMLLLQDNQIEDVSSLAWLSKLDEHSLALHRNPVASNPDALRELAEARERNRTRTTLTLGHVLGYAEYQVEDALAILRYTIGLPSVLDDCEVAMMAALVISSEVEGPQVDDALQILRYVVGLSSVFDEG